MFDIGWSELLMIGVVALFVFGPEDIPKIMYNLGRITRRFKYMRYALSSQFEDFMAKAEASGQVETRDAKTPTRDTHEFDETEADEYLMDLLPPPDEPLPDIEVNIPDPEEPHDKPDGNKTPDRG